MLNKKTKSIYIINIIPFVCVCVSDRQTFYHGIKTQHIIHGWIQNLSGHVTVINSNSSEAGIKGERNRAFRTSKPCLKHRFGNYYINLFMCHGNENVLLFKFIIYNYIIIAFEIKSMCIYVWLLLGTTNYFHKIILRNS